VAVSYAVTIGGIDSIAMMHLDTLTGLKEVKLCRAYVTDGRETNFFPANITKLAQARCIYETVPGWDEDITAVSNFNDLPLNAQDYVILVEEMTKRPVTMIGVGPRRSEIIFR
ncbi:MAG: adenylosuccinate synthetase, partial [Planctomycetota bacterium]|jgi:adenylosuccinate synthase